MNKAVMKWPAAVTVGVVLIAGAAWLLWPEAEAPRAIDAVAETPPIIEEVLNTTSSVAGRIEDAQQPYLVLLMEGDVNVRFGDQNVLTELQMRAESSTLAVDGVFDFAEVAPGSYTLLVVSPPRVTSDYPPDETQMPIRNVPLQVEEGQRHDVAVPAP